MSDSQKMNNIGLWFRGKTYIATSQKVYFIKHITQIHEKKCRFGIPKNIASSMCCGGFDEQFLDFLIQTKQHFSKTDNHDA